MKKLGVVITDGVGFRNFILSDFIEQATAVFDQVVLFSCLSETVYPKLPVNCSVIELPVFEEKFKTWFFRKCKEVAHLQLHKKNNFGIQDNLNANDSKLLTTRGYATRFIFKLTSLFHSEKWIQRYNYMQQLTFSNSPITKGYAEVFKKENPDILFFTHQRPPFIAPLAYLAERMKIKTCSFIFSWDNLASKGRMAANFDYFLVWSELMKQELQQFYVIKKIENIAVVGTPQFEPYVMGKYEPAILEFHQKFELDNSKKTICFSCGDISTSKNDELYISLIAKAILDKEIKSVNLLVRTSPAEDEFRFAVLAQQFPFIKWNYPKWHLSRTGHQEGWSQRIPSEADIKDLRSILAFSDVNVNMLSTMSLDFMQFDKPVINPVFGNEVNGLYNDQRFLNYDHIKNVVNSKATKIVTDKDALIEAINDYLANPETDKIHRQNLLNLQVSQPLQNTGERIAKTLLKWS